MPDSRGSQRPAYLLAGLLATSGALHFLRPKPFDALVPKELPGTPAPGRTARESPN
jgi:uncharacterized membrane protein